MARFKVWNSETIVEIKDNEPFQFPPSGDKILFKIGLQSAKTIKTD
ncbi:MAG: hypothetical protein ACOZBG_04810 [Candidatus Micrarchaeota archaeon]